MSTPAPGAADRAFGAENRLRLLARYFHDVAPEPVTAESMWRHIYRLLLWIDRTTGLAHCYESDKCQPGRPWYTRSLHFHRWLANELDASPLELVMQLDWLFRTATHELADVALRRQDALRPLAEQQRQEFGEANMPPAGEDAEMDSIVFDVLHPWLKDDPPGDTMRSLTKRLRAHVSTENKRKNLLGEGFEDTVAELLRRLPDVTTQYEVRTREHLENLPGFHAPRGGEKPKPVDLALIRRRDGFRILVSCKWSVRSDREEQLASDFAAYERREAEGQGFGYVLLTNEFDGARLASFCESMQHNSPLLTNVVHVATAGPKAAYAAPTRGGRRSDKLGAQRALGHMESGRLMDLASWVNGLTSPPGATS
jgi:hypothetical protein